MVRIALWLAVLCTGAVGTASAFNVYGRARVPSAAPPPADDPGEPLFLTPLLRAGNLTLARRLARVPATTRLGVESYSGYFTVDAAFDSNMFFWYFPPLTRAADAPLVVWLQGGPGASSLYGLFEEHGPVRVVDGRLERREYTWALSHHLVYFDNPVGTGFSFTNDSRGLCAHETCVGRSLRTALEQLVMLFPALTGRELYVTGESYAGKYVPALAHAVHVTPVRSLRLAGVAIGNGLTDPEHQLLYSEYLYQHGLLDRTQRDVFAAREEAVRDAIHAGRYTDAFTLFDNLLNGDLIAGKSLFYNMTGYEYYFNILKTSDGNLTDTWAALVGSNVMRRALHVGSREFSSGRDVERALEGDVMRSVAPWVAELLGHYRVLVYNGQLDIIVAYPLTESYLQQLKFPGAAEYRNAPRRIWRVGDDIAGYVKTAGNLTEVLVRNAGHMVPADQPRWALDLITRFTHRKQFHSHYEQAQTRY